MSLKWVATWSFAVAALALLLGALTPMHIAIPLTFLVLVGGGFVQRRRAYRAYIRLVARVEAVKGVRSKAAPLRLWSDPSQPHMNLSERLVDDLEESYFQLIQTNIQLLSLKEVGRSIIASLDQERTVESVVEYLNRGLGFEEFGLFTWDPRQAVFAGGVRQYRGEESSWVRKQFALHETAGVLAKSLGKKRSYLIKDAESHALGLVREELVAPGQHESFVIVPLVKTSPSAPNWQHTRNDTDRCTECDDVDVQQWVERHMEHLFVAEGATQFQCWACSGSPVLGCIIATDAGRAQPLSKVDLIMLETLAQNLATVLENAELYEELKREERFRENVIGGMSNGLLSVDSAGKVTLFNQVAEHLSGYDGAALRGRPSSQLIRDSQGRDPLRAALDGGANHRSVEASLKTAANKTLPIQLTTSQLRDESGEIYGAIGEFADLSAIKGMEAQIRHLDKLAALGRFTSSIAHEIRNPLAGITAGIQYLTKTFEGEDATHVSFILAEVDRLNRIINDLFAAGRPLELMLQEADISHLVDRSIRMLETRFTEREVRCEQQVADDLPRVAVDADRIEQVLINIIQNAIDASAPGATVRVEQELGSVKPLAEGSEVDSLIVRVYDDGEGIAAEDRDKIFEPFFTTKASGTGLGLYVCHHIVEGHGGSIVVESQPGQGTCFALSLPVGRIPIGGTSETADFARR